MNKKKIIIIFLCLLFLAVGLGTYLYLTKEDEKTSLNMIEKKWIENNKNQLLDISIFNDIPIFNYHGDGIVFEFLNSLEKETGLEFNKVSYTLGSEPKTELSFRQKSDLGENDILIYQDSYVLATSNGNHYNNPSEIKDVTVGVLNNDLDKINTYLLGSSINFRTFETNEDMIKALLSEDDNLDVIALPKIQYLETILSNDNLTIAYNITEYKNNFVLSLSTNSNQSTLNSILIKYYKKWSDENFRSSFDKYLVSNYFDFTGEGSQNNAKFHSKRYIYGFVDNKPYDAISDGELVGISSSIIGEFTKIANVVIEYKQYKNNEELINAFNTNEIDFFLETTSNSEYKIDTYKTISPFDESIMILTDIKKDIVVNSVNSLNDYTVSVVKGSKIASYLTSYGINIKEYSTTDALMKSKKSEVIALDYYNYQYYMSKGLKTYMLSYNKLLEDEYSYIFRDISDNKQFEGIFDFYLMFNSSVPEINRGISNTLSINVGSFIIRNIVILIIGLLLIGIVIFIIKKRKNKNNNRKNSLSKDDKLKYIDRLTSLKNRNYLNDNIEIWDDSEVYPQTIIIVDLNDIAYINDNYGHAEGDAVIKEAANILIQNQLANSEIIRTNGDEFLIYLVSYDEKQVISYMRKLSKEFKELSHGFGAAIGYSIINDAIKTIDDAVNEATIDMKNNKEEASKE